MTTLENNTINLYLSITIYYDYEFINLTHLVTERVTESLVWLSLLRRPSPYRHD